jgi:hypothetical protein
VSLVVPCNHSIDELYKLLRAVLCGTCLPSEILVVSSNSKIMVESESLLNRLFPEVEIDKLSWARQIKFYVCNVVSAFPGDARNIGLNHARGDLIAFLDVKTIPARIWLEKACEKLKDPNVDGVWGSRSYACDTVLACLIRDAIYGRVPVRSVAGSVFRRRVYSVVGQMISWAPAGEDGDWMHRVEAHKLSFLVPSEANHSYQGLDDKPLFFFIEKWWRYYHFSRLLPVNNRDRWLSFGLLYIILIFFAFNWNYKISAAILGSPLIVPHITTVLTIAGPVAYVFIRGIYLPLRRGVPFLRIFPARFVMLLMVTSVLDFIKTLALLLPLTLEHRFKRRSSETVAVDMDTKQPTVSSEK